MPKILIFTAREGHLSLAQALTQIFKKKGFLTESVDFWSTNKRFALYVPFYRYFPSFLKIPYKLAERETILKTINVFTERWVIREIKEKIKSFQPDLIISTYPFYNPALARFLDYQKNPLSFINIITNPLNIHPLELSNAGYNLFYNEKGVKLGLKNKLNPEKLLPLGWFIRQEFYQKYPIAKIRKSLGFKKNVFTLLVCGGSEGSASILKIFPGLLTIKKPVQVMVVCGTNKTLFKTLKAFKNLLPKLRISPQLNLKLFRFTKLPQLMAISNLVMGKAGPNLLFETIAMKKPFFALCHIAGQEDDNLSLIKKKGLGFVEENTLDAINLLKKIISQPQFLARFSFSINKERSANLRSGPKLLKLIRHLMES